MFLIKGYNIFLSIQKMQLVCVRKRKLAMTQCQRSSQTRTEMRGIQDQILNQSDKPEKRLYVARQVVYTLQEVSAPAPSTAVEDRYRGYSVNMFSFEKINKTKETTLWLD